MMPFSWAASSASAICVASDYSVFEGNRTAGDAVGERLAVDELEDEHLLTIDLFQPVDRADVRVVERRQHLRFAPEAREPFGSMGEAVRQRFQRDVTTQPCVSGPIDLSHTAGTERRQDFVRTEARTEGERHLARVIVVRLDHRCPVRHVQAAAVALRWDPRRDAAGLTV